MTTDAPPVSPAPTSRPLRRGVFRLLRIFALVYLGLVIMLAALQRSLIYAPDRQMHSATEAGLPAENVKDVTLTTSDGLTLHGWHSSPAIAPTADGDRRLVILFPGNAGNRAYRGAILRSFNELGCEVLIFDYRGYGENPGSPSEKAFAADALAVWTYARDGLGFPANRIILCGESLGGGVATRLAWDLKQQGISPGGLILRTTFSSLVETAARHYPWLPVRTILVDRYPSIERIDGLTCPILVYHGDRDTIVPFAQAKELFDAAPAQSANGILKTFLPLPGAGHNDIEHVAGREIHEAHRKFLEQLRK